MKDHFQRAYACYEQGDFIKAIKFCRREIKANPENLNAILILAAAHAQSGQLNTSIKLLRDAGRRWPTETVVHTNLATALFQSGALDDAIREFHTASQLSPNDPECLNNYAACLLVAQVNFDEAEMVLRKAISLSPYFADALYNYGILHRKLKRPLEAIDFFEQALKQKPHDIKILNSLGDAYDDIGQVDQAINTYKGILKVVPDYVPALWGACLSLPIIYLSETEIADWREKYCVGLDRFLNSIDLENSNQVDMAYQAITARTNFYLPYQGQNDLDPQKLFGTFIWKINEKLFSPTWMKPIKKQAISPDRQIKVGFVSAFWRDHTIYKLFSGWIKHLNRATFEVFVIYTGDNVDEKTSDIEQHSDHFLHLHRSPEQTAKAIYDQKLDILIYPEIGMDARTQTMAGMRLAPVQCLAWGHPTTTGMPTMDFFLSSDLMEPPDAQNHYTEELVRLPNLSICYDEPEVDQYRGNLKQQTVNPRVDFLCTQSLFKLIPQYDHVFVDIASKVKNCRFSFIVADNTSLTELVKNRLLEKFAQQELNGEDYLHFYPLMDRDAFFSVHFKHDIILDTLGWSGGNTAFEAVACGMPIVTWPGPMMRGRHSYAILRRLGLEEIIAQSPDDYVEIATRLALDPTWRNAVSEKITKNKRAIYNDKDAIRDFEKFIDAAVHGFSSIPFTARVDQAD